MRIVVDDGRVTRFEHWGVERGLLNDGDHVRRGRRRRLALARTRHGLSRLDPASGRVVNHVPQSGLPVSALQHRRIRGRRRATCTSVRWTAWSAFRKASHCGFARRAGADHGHRAPRRRRQRALSPGETDRRFEIEHRRRYWPRSSRCSTSPRPRTTTPIACIRRTSGLPLGRRRQLTFFGLAPGRYQFEVRGRDAFGQWSASPPFAFEVVPPLWMTPLVPRPGAGRARAAGARRAPRPAAGAAARATPCWSGSSGSASRRSRDARRSQAELEEAYAGLRQLTGRLESAKEDERSRISRELHDEFGQTLTAAKLNLQMLRSTMADAAAVAAARGLGEHGRRHDPAGARHRPRPAAAAARRGRPGARARSLSQVAGRALRRAHRTRRAPGVARRRPGTQHDRVPRWSRRRSATRCGTRGPA